MSRRGARPLPARSSQNNVLVASNFYLLGMSYETVYELTESNFGDLHERYRNYAW